MATLGKIRRMYYRDGLSLSEISRRTSLSRNTVRDWLKKPEGSEPKYRRQAKPGKLAAFEAFLTQSLETDLRRPKRDRRTARALFAEVQAQGYSGGHTLVSDFVRKWRPQGGKPLTRAYVPLRFELGEAFQFDWSEEGLVIGGVWRRILAAHMKLCASRAFMLAAYPSQGHEMLFDAHTRCFTALGGIPKRGIYDDMKTAVDKVGAGEARHPEYGDLSVAEMLATVPKAGLEAVLVAAELALESGAVNAEHLHNMLARLRPTPAIPRVETDLTVLEAPVADAGRYDRLRAQEVDHA